VERRSVLWAVLAVSALALPSKGQAVGEANGESPVRPADGIVSVGAGSYRVGLPPGAKGPPQTIYAAAGLRGPYPTNDWWSSLLWEPFSQPHFSHPLAIRAEAGGLRVQYPGPGVHANREGIFGAMGGGKGDLVLGLDADQPLADARVEGYSDWFVTVRFGPPGAGFSASYGHGSPYVYAMFDASRPRVSFARPAEVFAGRADSSVLGVRVGRSCYGLFAPAGSTWTGLGGDKLVCQPPAGKRYLSLAVLPDDKKETLALFARCAHAHVTDTRVAWRYDPATDAVRTTFTFTTTPRDGSERSTLTALYPHQWRFAQAELTGQSYASVRGTMKLARGTSFQTILPLGGGLPVLPRAAGVAPAEMARLLGPALNENMAHVRDTYAEGKVLGKLATAAAVAEQYGLTEQAAELRKRVRERLEEWLTARGDARAPRMFCYEPAWGTLIGLPPSFGSDRELNDHHFHYGYFLQAAVEVARHDPAWASDRRWGGMLRVLIRDIASADRGDKLFPFLRCFDPYAGHSWASGHAKFGDGNNQESSSEAMNAWWAILMLGEALGDRELRDLGAYLYATERSAVREYWFNEHGSYPSGAPECLAMIWGGKGVYATWFSARPEHVAGINLLPMHGGSLYLDLPPAVAHRQWDALMKRTGGELKHWADIFWMARAMSDPEEAGRLLEAAGPDWKPEAGNSKANTVHWVRSLMELGTIDRSVRADAPFCAVFRRDNKKTYAAWNLGPNEKTMTFSDGRKVTVPAKSWRVVSP